MCVLHGGATALPIPTGPGGSSRIRFIYVYNTVVFVLYSYCRVPYSQRTPPHHLSFVPYTDASHLSPPPHGPTKSTKLTRKWQQR